MIDNRAKPYMGCVYGTLNTVLCDVMMIKLGVQMCVHFYFFISPVFINSSGPGQLERSPPGSSSADWQRVRGGV